MSEDEESYCRLCAEPTQKSQLIAPDEDVGINSKIATKMMWINVDTTLNNLPNSICFSCFDLLERTWTFLHEVRAAQVKLKEIFIKNDVNEIELEITPKLDPDIAGKPVDNDWENFEDNKQEVKTEELNEQLHVTLVDPKTLLDLSAVKTEINSNDDDDYRPDSDGGMSTDSDQPLLLAIDKNKQRKKRKLSNNSTESIVEKKYSKNWNDCLCICGECGAQCENIASLRVHAIQIHSHCCKFKCPDCNKTTKTHKSFLAHLRYHKKYLRSCCEFCNKHFVNSLMLKNHIISCHIKIKKLLCRYCGLIFENTEQLTDHLAIYSSPVKRIKKEGNISDTGILTKCEFCEKEFKTKGSLQTHRLLHTERQRDFSCHICGKTFYTKGTLGIHLQSHDDTKPFKCEFCPLSFKARGNLRSHISLHSGAKPFVCEQCGKSFRAKRQLKSHSIVHTDLMPFNCHYCEKAFRFKTRLNLHLRQHTGSKPYRCAYCQRDFTNGSNYKKHMRRKHNIDTSRKKYNNIVSNEDLETSVSLQ